MALYVYADETIFPINGEKNGLGYGLFVSQTEITQRTIDEALSNLKSDLDFDLKKDSQTLQKGYFHASEDGKNAHSHLCTSINKNVKGIFAYTYSDHNKPKEIAQKGFTNRILNRCLSDSTLELFRSTEEIFLTIEQRDTLSKFSLAKWLKSLYELYDKATYDILSFKTFYPNITITLKDKKEPGLQVIDFLIWAVNRTKRNIPDKKWHERIRYASSYYSVEQQGQNGGQYYLNTLHFSRTIPKGYPYEFIEPQNWNALLKAYLNIERFLVLMDKKDFTDETLHLYNDFSSISSKLKIEGYHLNKADISLLGSVFLRLFDSIPLYQNLKDEDIDSWTVILQSKYLASILVRKGNLRFIRTKNAIQRWRYKMQTENREEFRNLIYK